MFKKILAKNPDRTAVIHGETRYTYKELASLVSGYSRLFRDRLNPQPGQVVLAWLDNGPELIAGFLSAAKEGTILFPLNIHWRQPEVRWFLDRLPVAGVVTKTPFLTTWEALTDRISPDRVINLDDPMVSACVMHERPIVVESDPEIPDVSPERPVMFFSSSGSTGVPKIVPRSHINIIEGTTCKALALGITPGLRFMSIIPFYHANGFDNSLALPLLSGATAVVEADFVPSRFAETMIKHNIEVLIGSPAIFELLLRFELDPACLSTLRICASSGGPIPADTLEAVKKRFGITVRQIYGSTETNVIAIEPQQGGPSLVPLPNMKIKIIDGAGRPLPPGEKGEITVKGPSVMSGYVDRSPEESGVFRDGYYCTGDRGYIDSSGNLTLSGRIRPLINLSGTKVDPMEVENVIRAMPEVNACRVFSVTGLRHNEIIKAVIALREGSRLSREDVIGACRTRLAEYKIPRIIEFVSSMPSDLTGKSAVLWENKLR